MMRVPVEAGASFMYGNPVRTINVSEYLLEPAGRPYDISPDGRRFLMIKNDTTSGAATINVVLNWTEELKRLGPVN